MVNLGPESESLDVEDAPPSCIEKTTNGIFKCWNVFARGFGKCMGLDDDAYAVSDDVQNGDSIDEMDVLKKGFLDIHNDKKEEEER